MKQEEFTFEKYLYKIGFSDGSVKSYLYQVENYLTTYPDAEKFKHKDLLNALDDIGKLRPNARYKIAILSAIKKYYDYLVEIGRRDDHPCRTVFIRFNRNPSVIHNDLFSSPELELLMDRKDRYPHLKLKNQVVLSLLIYQGLTSGEIANMKVQHVNLDEGKIFVKESRDIMRRHLEMHPKQYRIFDKYITESRKNLLKVETDKLVIGIRGVPTTVGEVGYLVEQFWPLFPGRKLNPLTIRQSVISNWLNEKRYPLETVQLMAGHRWISTTARYKYTPHDEKRLLINRFHPLG